jgi:hypothetical protein
MITALTAELGTSLHVSDSEMLRAGVSFPALMKLLGHTSPQMTMQYLVAVADVP